ncbi:MAG: sensor histidine kinase [Lachnospiraceae bacterium]
MPNFILQPIVENAIAHGLRNDRKKEKQLSITLERCNSDILFAIHDNGLGMDPDECKCVLSRENEGIGLKNIHDRLQLCYGSDYGITISSEKNVGTTVYVRLADQIQSDHKS